MKPKTRKRILVAMSGGVDSAVAAYLLKEAGHEVVGATMKLWPDSECLRETEKSCCSLRDIQDARLVAAQLSIPHYVVDLAEIFKKKVINWDPVSMKLKP